MNVQQQPGTLYGSPAGFQGPPQGSVPPVVTFFKTEVFLPRLYQSVYRSFAVQIIILVLWVGFHHFSLLSPWQGLCQTGNVFLLPGSWLYLVLVFICLACQGVLLGRHVAVEPFVAKNRAAYLLRMSEADALLSLSSSMLIGGVLVRCYLGLQDDVSLNHLTVSCAEDSDSKAKCLNEAHVFLVFSGMHTALTFWGKMLFQNGNLLIFPPIKQNSYTRLRMRLYNMMKTSMFDTILSLRWFLLFYLILGYRCSESLRSVFRLEATGKWESITSQLILLSQTLVLCWLLNSLLCFSLSCAREITFIEMTKPMAFRMVGRYCLTDAMVQTQSRLLRYLAFQDLIDIAFEDKSRREELFQLSQPGGHPRNWRRMYGILSETIQNFIAEIAAPSQLKPSSNDEAPRQATEDEERKNVGSVFNPTMTLNFWKTLLVRNPLFIAHPDAAMRTACASSQLIIWTVEGLSGIVAAAALEDAFGVVQRTLPDILTLLLTLQQTFDRHKSVTSYGSTKNRYAQREVELRQELRSSIKSSLYRVTVAYGDSLLEVSVSPEHRARIENFLNFKEG